MGALKRRPLLGTLVPVEEPSTASQADVAGKLILPFQLLECMPLQTEALSCGKSHCFDLVSVKIANESTIIVGVVIFADTGRAFI
jgi:hypothetical protein